MKTLLLIRHAKSDQSFFGNDFERPLNERGKADAPIMAQRLLDKQITIDAFVSSPAKRAKKTAELFCAAFKREANEIFFLSKLYHAAPEVFYEVASELDDNHHTVAVFSHNPGITYFVNEVVKTERMYDMPTCAIFAIKIDSDKWSDFHKAKKEFLFFDYPKNNL
ncbi:histidine phosphatase family protein [Ferruginibacter lapsinanis]|uniref:SixA phosphatase family protein n=1 Tax=Ferruginibacter lapsinanis TaxID=563172 RepID=UPI001E4D8BCB|nr:histidine phosphatase family protein [Ferruginibacter lapsinanis]UEG50853.1 histidine phosphatase family protein [Ferruginibacter lapsinanis]